MYLLELVGELSATYPLRPAGTLEQKNCARVGRWAKLDQSAAVSAAAADVRVSRENSRFLLLGTLRVHD